ncbi:MAG: redoxin family protein [Planctomycetota bacterium]|jgi:thiol-disulfide isomerase/thioredoxin
MRRVVLPLLLACTLPVLPGAAWGDDDATRVLGREAPAWEVPTWIQLPEGASRLEPADLRGRVVLLTFFQATCPACRERALPDLARLATHFARAGDVAIVAIETVFEVSARNTPPSLSEIAARYGLPIPLGHVADAVVRPSGLLGRYRAAGTPWTVLIDPRGIVRHAGWTPSQETIRQLVERLRGRPKAPNPLVGTAFGAWTGVRWVTPGAAPLDFARHKLTLVRWWTTDCPFCRDSLPALGALGRRYRERGLHTVAVYHPKSRRRWRDDQLRAYLGRLGFGGTLAVDPRWQKLRDLMGRGRLERATSISLLVDREGVVRWVHPGPRIHAASDPRYAAAAADLWALEGLVADTLTTPPPPPSAGFRLAPRR